MDNSDHRAFCWGGQTYARLIAMGANLHMAWLANSEPCQWRNAGSRPAFCGLLDVILPPISRFFHGRFFLLAAADLLGA